MAVQFEPIVGRYMTLELGGRPHRIYFEQAGEGIPLLCLHTAGADGRQFRHLMLDEDIIRNYRVLAFDMPWHGKSLPPEGWQREEYRLTTAAYTEMIVAFCRALELRRPVVMGCSIGGRIVLNLTIECAAMFRALIGLEAADFQAPWYDTAWLNRPDVHGGEVCAALVSGLIAPQSPAAGQGPKRYGPTSRADPAYSRATCISIGSTAICAAGSGRSILKYASCFCSPASMISPARRRILNGPLPPSGAPVSRSWSNLVIFQ